MMKDETNSTKNVKMQLQPEYSIKMYIHRWCKKSAAHAENSEKDTCDIEH